MKKFLFLFFAIYANFAFGQVQNGEKHVIRDSILNEKPAEFPKGTIAFRNLISSNINMENIIGDGKYYCELYFIIDKEGNITDIKTIGNNESFNREAEIAISKIKDKWIPAELNGAKVRYKFRVPLNVSFEGENGYANFSKGEEVFKQKIVENFRIEKFKRSNFETCEISFLVQTNGMISNIKSIGNNKAFNKEVVRAVSKIREAWIPMFVRDIPVPSEVKIKFEMNF